MEKGENAATCLRTGRHYGPNAFEPTLAFLQDFTNLVNELGRLVMAEELFTFVLEATNNQSERNLRSPAQDRKAGRTNKTATGAHRRSVIVSVLQSLRANLETFSLTTVLEETVRWMNEGLSLFAEQWHALRAAQSAEAAAASSG